MQPEIHLGPLDLQTFGICFAFAFVASAALFARRLRELGKPPDWTYEAIFAALIGGLVGSRLDFLIQNWDNVSGDLLGNIFSGAGLVFFGGLIGGAIGVLLWARWRGWLGWELLDSAAAPIAIGYAVGGSAASSRATATTASRRTCRGRWRIPRGRSRPPTRCTRRPIYETCRWAS